MQIRPEEAFINRIVTVASLLILNIDPSSNSNLMMLSMRAVLSILKVQRFFEIMN